MSESGPRQRLLERIRERDHTQGSLLASMAVLAVPLLTGNLLGAIILQVVDLYFLSRMGEEAMASVIIVNQTVWQLMMMLVMGTNFSTQSLVSQAVGSGDEGRARVVAAQSIFVGLSLAAFAVVGGLFFGAELYGATGGDAGFAGYGVPYLRLQLGLSWAIISSMILRSVLVGAGDTTTPLLTTVVQTPVTLLVEWALIFGHLGAPALGVRGVAIGMASGHILSLSLGLWILLGGRTRIHLKLSDLVPKPAVMREIVALSWPPAVQMIGMVISTFALLRLTRSFGTEVQAAYSIGLRVGMIVPLMGMPLANACATLVGQAIGARNPARARQAVRTGVKLHGSVMWTAAALVALFRSQLMAAVTSDPEVIRIGSEYLLFLAGNFTIMGIQLVVMRALQGAGDFFVPMGISIGTTLLVALPAAYFLSLHTPLEETGIWAGNLLAGVVGLAAMLAWMRTGRWLRGAHAEPGAQAA